MPGEHDWMKRVGMGGIFGSPQMGNPGTPGATPPTGSWADKLMAAMNSQQGQLGLRILANNQGGASLGNVLGKSAMEHQQAQAQSVDEDFRRRYMEAQIQKMQQPEKDNSAPVIVQGPDGKPRYVSRQEAVGQQPYMQPQGEATTSSMIQEWKASGVPDFMQFMQKRAQMMNPQAEPLVAIQTPDGRSVLVPRSQAVGASPAAPRENFVPTEGERTSGNYLGRMDAAEKLLGEYVPSTMDYIAADRSMRGGPVMSSIANAGLSKQGQQYYQAAADWVRAKLRKESGAVISPEEMAQEIKTYFPMPGDKPETVKQKAQARKQAQEGMRGMAGRAAPQNQPQATSDPQADPLGILK